jgi:hypothetical protein
MFTANQQYNQPNRLARHGSFQDNYSHSPQLSPSPQNFNQFNGGFFGGHVDNGAAPYQVGQLYPTVSAPELPHHHNQQNMMYSNSHPAKNSHPLGYSYPGQSFLDPQASYGPHQGQAFQSYGQFNQLYSHPQPQQMHPRYSNQANDWRPEPSHSFNNQNSGRHNFLNQHQPPSHQQPRSMSVNLKRPEPGLQQQGSLNYIADTDEDVIVRSPPGMKLRKDSHREETGQRFARGFDKNPLSSQTGSRYRNIFDENIMPDQRSPIQPFQGQSQQFSFLPEANNRPLPSTTRTHRHSEVLDRFQPGSFPSTDDQPAFNAYYPNKAANPNNIYRRFSTRPYDY